MNSNTNTKLFTLIFVVVSSLDILGILLHNSLLQTIFKPMIILSLMVLYYFSAKVKNNWYLLALAFSFLGDVFLMDKNDLFLIGIAAFLITQIIYIKIILAQLKASNLSQKTIANIPFALYLFVLLFVLKDNLNEFLIPVIVYGFAISVFGMLALLNFIVDKTKTARILFLGAVLFIISDSLIALDKFYEEKPFYGFFIMITYIVAQYLIFRYMVVKSEVKSQKSKVLS